MEINEQSYSSDEPYLSSGSEYVPETESSESEEISQPKSKSRNTHILVTGTTPKTAKIDRNNTDTTIIAFDGVTTSKSKVEHFSNYRPWTKKIHALTVTAM
nr:unnamed protein product [Callosobruchus analis]